jgi:hypothetical protein
MDDDYLSYIDKGIKTTKVRDYVDYAGDDEKSSGIFSANGLLSKEEKKELREELRETKSTIWDYVISFEEKYGKENCYSWQKAKDLLAKTLPGYFKSIGLDPEKTVVVRRAPREHRQPAHPPLVLPKGADRLRPEERRPASSAGARSPSPRSTG